MKLVIPRFTGRLGAKTLFLSLCFGLMLFPFAVRGTDAIYISPAQVYSPPNVDATAFYNGGMWDIGTSPYPFQTQNTLYYTNNGTMTGSVGWEFDFGPLPNGGRGWSASFVNGKASSTIQALDSSVRNPVTLYYYPVSYLWVSATNIIAQGGSTLGAGPNGEVKLTGGNVNLSRSILKITPIVPTGGATGGTNFTSDTAIYSTDWGQTNGLIFNSAALWDGTNVAAPFYYVYDNCSTNPAPGALADTNTPTVADSLITLLGSTTVTVTNSDGTPSSIPNFGTNYANQAAFVLLSANNGVTAQIRFSPSANLPPPALQNVAVQFTAPTLNAITLVVQTNYLYLVDTLATATNTGLNIDTNFNPNYPCSGFRYRPANYILSRLEPAAFALGVPGSGLPAANFFFQPDFTNSMVSANYGAYAAFIDSLSAEPVNAAVTNLPGRIGVYANNLNLSQMRASALGEITIHATNVGNLAGANAVLDSQYLSLDLGSTNGYLNISNLVSQNVARFQGSITNFSAVWTNYLRVVFESYESSNRPPPSTNVDWYRSDITNYIQEEFSILIVDARQLTAQAPVIAQDLRLHSTNIVINDPFMVAESFLLDCRSFTLNRGGDLIFPGYFAPNSIPGETALFDSPLQNWVSALAPTLLYFTNYGFIFVENSAHFGDDTAVPYSEFINGGGIYSGDQTIRSLDFQIVNGINYTFAGNFSATAQSIKITGPPVFGFSYSIYSANDIDLTANTLVFDPAALYANGALNFNVTNTLSDNNTAGSFTCYNGFNLWIKPQYGDLNGSAITNIASVDYATIDHAWAGQDRGPSLAGYTNNVGIGTLVLSAQNPDAQFPPLFHFYGTTGSNGMYVGVLDLSQLTANPANLANMIQIDPGLKIYVQYVNLGFVPPGGQAPADYLTNRFPGQFIKLPFSTVSQSSTVDWNTVYQRIDGFGASSAWQSTWTTTWADMFFSTNNGTAVSKNGTNFSFTGIGLSLLRNRIVPAATDASVDVPSTVEFDIMQMAQARGARVWSSPWTPAAQFKNNTDLDGGSFLGYAYNYRSYASQLANYVVSMKNAGINLYAISIQNEPDANVTTYESCNWTPRQMHDFVPYLYNTLVASNVASTKIMIPESQNWLDPLEYADTVMSDSTSNYVGIIAEHNYDGADGPATLTRDSYGKALWQTEVSLLHGSDSSIANGVYWAERIYLFLTVAQVNAWHYWWLIPGNSTGNQGLCDTNWAPAKRMYTLGQYSRFVRPGYYRIGVNTGGGALQVSAFKDTNALNFAIVAVNANGNLDVSQTFNLANFPGASTVTPWITSATDSLAPRSAVAVSNLSFTYTIPAQSVVTFIGQANSSAPTAATQPATGVGNTTAILNSTVTPNGLPTSAWFNWGTTTNYGASTGPVSVGSGTSPVPFNASLAGLNPVTTYHFRVVATNSAGTNYGADQFFTTLPPAICTVDWGNVHQRIDGFGASSAWQSYMSTAQADLLFSINNGIVYTDNLGSTTTNNGIGLSLLRNHIYPAGSTSSDDVPYTTETSIMQMAQDRGARVWSAPWTPASGFKDSGSPDGGNYLGYGANPTNLAYAQQLANYVVNMEQYYGVTIYALSVQNEPDYNTTSYESCVWTGSQIHDFVTNLYAALVATGVGSTQIIIPESENWSSHPDLWTPTLSDTNAAADVSIIANHNYTADNTVGDLTTPAQLSVGGKTTWETEVSQLHGSDSSIINGLYWGQRIYLFLTQAQVNAYHYWWLESFSSAAGNPGLLDNNGSITKRLFVFGQYSRFVRPGYYRIDATNTGDVLISAFEDTNSGNFVMVAVNINVSTDISQTFNLTNFPAVVSSVTPWITSATNSLANLAPVSVSGSSFTYMLPAQSVVTFAGQAIGPAVRPALIANQTINVGTTLLVTNSATSPNVPPALTFSKLSGPTNASLGATYSYTNALFTWRPLVSQANTTNLIMIKIADHGIPSLTATNSFTVKVNPLTPASLKSIGIAGGQIYLTITNAQVGPDYTLWTTTNLLSNWTALFTTNSPPHMPVTLVVTNSGGWMRFYRVQLGP
jgi:glucuronoarabinoxylan endo-1,4-beta-xylanase